jgi:hypothetical protein
VTAPHLSSLAVLVFSALLPYRIDLIASIASILHPSHPSLPHTVRIVVIAPSSGAHPRFVTGGSETRTLHAWKIKRKLV